ncbi:hypothetical protein [Pseudomonas sp.]|uniref:hypothetical protein n=1 Tax=Pseudomonas sp. TaxID=306 RepID=UPI0027354BF9|nr:hypothetical protein [Pseudomonas sp.]MDP2745353.1 hypothetical protein [Pseudomonas sp.]
MDMLLFFRTIWRSFCHTLGRRSAASLIAVLLVGWSSAANALWALGMVPGVYIPQIYYKHGAVYTRAIVLSPAGNPYYVEYDNSGNEGREIAEKTGQYERAQIMAGAYYRSLLQRLADTKERYPEHEEMTAAAYRGSTFKTAGGESIQKPSISPTALTVLVRAQNNRYLKDGSDLLLLELPIKSGVQPSASSKSLLVSEAGDILHQTANTIAFRVGFFGKDGKVETNKRRDHGSEIYGKMPSVPVTLGGHITGGYAITDADGNYSMHYFLPSCPGFTFEYTTPVYLELYYSRFNPRGNSMMPYYLVRQDYDFCNGLSAISMLATLAMTTSATFVKPKFDFPVDLMVIDGAAAFANVKLDAKTAYNPQASDYAKTIQEAYDFDGDEKPEIIVPGKKVKKTIDGKEREVFVETAVAEAELQGIYLSSRHSAKPASTEDTAPDFTRLIDTKADFKDRGLLQSISKDDLRDTDIYVFRESTGQLVAERRGLHESELYKTFSGVDDKQGSFRFTIQLRGSAENTYALSGRSGEANFNKWQSAGGFTEEFQKRTANHLKSGEQVRIIAINRPTGYMGSTRINLNASLNGNMIDLNQARIQLTPPNLKIWAERKNKIEQGMTRGEEKKQLIGNEGAGLGSDISIAIYSDWRDQDGGPLPEALADYGYTGRLAKIVAANQLAPVGANNLSQFKIKPGQQVQIIQLPEKVLAKQHLYLQVAGQPENRNPDFATGNGEGILKYRPSKYVPVQVPLHDEQASEIARQAYRKADKEKPELNLKKPEPMYSWQYRPEMQFSLYELTVDSIKRTEYDSSLGQKIDLDKPALSATDKLVEFVYSLLQSEFTQLTPIDMAGEREMILAVGEQETKVKIGTNQSITFDNIDHLTALDVDDFLSIRLYANNDVGNILWEWAFDHMLVIPLPLPNGDTIKITADTAAEGFQSVEGLVLRPKGKEATSPYTIGWSVQGNATPSSTGETNTTGYFSTALKLPTTAKQKVSVTAHFKEPYDLKAPSATYEIIPGKPYEITHVSSGKTVIGGLGGVELELTFKDRFGNLVEDGTIIGINAADMRVEGNFATVNGKIKIKAIGDTSPGAKELIVKAGDIEKSIPVTVEDVALVIEAPSNLVVGGSGEVTIKAESAYGDLTGLSLQVTSLRGAVEQGDLKIEAGNMAKTRLNAGNFEGAGKVIARINDSLYDKAFSVKAPANALRLSNRLLVSSRIGSPDGTDGFSAETDVLVPGAEGETVSIDLKDYLKPNLLPLAFWDLQTPAINGRFVDDEFGRELIANKAQVQSIGLGKKDKFIVFGETDSRLALSYDGAFARTDNVGISFAFSADPVAFGRKLVDLSASGLKIELTSIGEVKVTAQMESGTRELTTAAVQSGAWHRLGVHVVEQTLIVQLDKQILKVPLEEPLKGQQEQYALVIGEGFQGRLNELGVYDWSQAPVLRLASGNEQADATVGADGMARFRLISNFSNLMALRETPNKELLSPISQILIAHAAPVDDAATCNPVMTDDLIGSAEAFLKFVVDCQLQKKIRQAEIKVKTSSGVLDTVVAYAELSTLKTLRTQLNVAGTSVIYLSQCIDGIITGSVDSAASTICDFVASLLLVGDIRDFVIHGYYFYTDNTEKFDQATYVFAGLGIAGTLAELTGVGISVDAALAGGKTAAKVMKGSKVLTNLVSYLDAKVLNGLSGTRTAALKKVVPILQVVAFAAYEGGTIKDFLVKAVDSVDDFDIWVGYTYWMIEEGAINAVTVTQSPALDRYVAFFVGAAYAAGIDDILKNTSVAAFIKVLKEVEEKTQPFKSKNKVAAHFTQVIGFLVKERGGNLDELAKKSPDLMALLAVYARGGQEGLAALRRTPCTPSDCFGGKSFSEFVQEFYKLELKFSKGADPQNYSAVLGQIGAFVKDSYDRALIFVARGGAGTIRVASKKFTQEGDELIGFEISLPEIMQKIFGKRTYDIVVKRNAITYFVEVKSWNKHISLTRIKESLNFSKKTDGTDGAPGQLMKDLATYLGPGGNKNIRWEFSDETIDRLALINEVKAEIIKEGKFQQYLLGKIKPGGEFDDIKDAVDEAVKVILSGVPG